jgi:hypothetical protein
MSTTFSRSMRSLERDGFRFTLAVLLIAALLLVAWGVWFFLATVPLYTVTHTFDLEVNGGSTTIIAELDPDDSADVRPQQKAWLRLKDTPALPATVTRVDGAHIELIVDEKTSPNLTPQENLTGRVEIELERVTPSTLLLRSIGRD